MPETIPHLINGQLINHQAEEQLPVYNPATGEQIALVKLAGKQSVDEAVAAAQGAFASWSQTPPQKRVRILFRYQELLAKHTEEIAQLVTKEHGKTIEDAKGSIARALECIEYNCGIPRQLAGSFSENVADTIDCYTLRQPLGVCAGISPFNFPVMVPVWQFIPAIACGNTFVIKPSEQDPTPVLRIVELLHEAGLPAGVVNVINGDKDAVNHLCQHPHVQAVTAVGSSYVAQSIYQLATTHGKRSTTFGGAKNHCVVMPDCDLEQTAQAILGAAYGSAGERCMAISVAVVVGEETADKLAAKIQAGLSDIVVGPGHDPQTSMGPLISKVHREKVCDYVAQGIKEGATCLADGRELTVKDYPEGYYLGPCLFDHVKENMKIYQQEIFGPVLGIVRVASLDEAIALTSRHPYGNGTAIFTQDGSVARRFSNQVQVGMVGINVAIPVPIAYHSFGGWKASMFGDIAMHGDQSVQFYTKLKTITTRWPRDLLSDKNFSMPSH